MYVDEKLENNYEIKAKGLLNSGNLIRHLYENEKSVIQRFQNQALLRRCELTYMLLIREYTSNGLKKSFHVNR